MIRLELTPKIKEWLDTAPRERSLEAGARLLLQVTRNKILYGNIMRNLEARGSTIEYQLQKVYNQRLADITHEQVRGMMKQVAEISKARGLEAESRAPRSEYQRGKRADHDMLPAEVQQLYVDNAEILRRMRDTHTKLRLITPENSTCPDNDRYPLAKYLIEQDRLYRDNWNRYDHYIKGTPVSSTAMGADPRSESKNAAKLCHLLLGKYAAEADEALAARIRAAYSKVTSPTERLTEKMRGANLL